MRGEYSLRIPGSSPCTELPPRARRIQLWQRGPRINGGTTSACAENTGNPAGKKTLSRNYLRVRGEYQADANRHFVTGELPPRARRIPLTPMCLRQQQGTTSACAENTVVDHRPRRPRGNYLRVRGEYRSNHFFHASVVELPPRARRILVYTFSHGLLQGTTSACAENTCSNHILRKSMWNYLRVRGEYMR